MGFSREQHWTAKEAADWVGLNYRTALKLFRDGVAPCIPIGAPTAQNMGKGRKKRKRTCGRYLVPKKAFIAWFETLRPAQEGSPSPQRPPRRRRAA